MDGCQLIRAPCLLAICSHSVFARVLRVVKVIIGNASYLCVSVSVRVRACVCVPLLLCLGIQIREEDYIREDGNRWREKEEGDNYV